MTVTSTTGLDVTDYGLWMVVAIVALAVGVCELMRQRRAAIVDWACGAGRSSCCWGCGGCGSDGSLVGGGGGGGGLRRPGMLPNVFRLYAYDEVSTVDGDEEARRMSSTVATNRASDGGVLMNVDSSDVSEKSADADETEAIIA